ncbi:SCO family protein [Chitinophaga rhizosphaerae]|uniref:SCO family protein n=1 Tax=Chitinophaga rhizosphaerae TaxID=1864947 RepID=UPI000F7FABEC|nr:SCO family protein [Chitinophaga rhizosphaerae]
MKMTKGAKLAIIAIIATTVIGIASLTVYIVQSRQQLPVLGEPGHHAGSFAFMNQDGRTLTEKDVAGKVTVVEYFFTTCPGICKQMNRNLDRVYKEFRNNPDFMILSHTVDPEMDSVPVLHAYAATIDALGGNWQFLTGNKDTLYRMAREEYLLSVEDSGKKGTEEDFIHTQYVCLVDGERRLRGFYDATDSASVGKMIEDAKILISD